MAESTPRKQSPQQSNTRVPLWIGRILGGLIVFYWLFMVVAGAVDDSDSGPWTWEHTGIVFFISTLTLSYFVALFRQRLGAFLLIILGLGFSVFAQFSAGHNHFFAVMVSGVPFLIIVLLFLTNSKKKNV